MHGVNHALSPAALRDEQAQPTTHRCQKEVRVGLAWHHLGEAPIRELQHRCRCPVGVQSEDLVVVFPDAEPVDGAADDHRAGVVARVLWDGGCTDDAPRAVLGREDLEPHCIVHDVQPEGAPFVVADAEQDVWVRQVQQGGRRYVGDVASEGVADAQADGGRARSRFVPVAEEEQAVSGRQRLETLLDAGGVQEDATPGWMIWDMDDALGGDLAVVVCDAEDEAGGVEAATVRRYLEHELAEVRGEDGGADDPAGRGAADDGRDVGAGDDLEYEIDHEGRPCPRRAILVRHPWLLLVQLISDLRWMESDRKKWGRLLVIRFHAMDADLFFRLLVGKLNTHPMEALGV